MPESKVAHPFDGPNPYDTLGVKKGIRATAKEIGKSFNRQKREARRISHLKDRAARMEALDRAKERLQRPENRILLDFFILGEDVFADLSCDLGQRFTKIELNTAKIVGPLLPKRSYDDLVPSPLDQVLGEFQLVKEPEWYEDVDEMESRVTLVHFEP